MESYISKGKMQSSRMCIMGFQQKAAYLEHTGLLLVPDKIAFLVPNSN